MFFLHLILFLIVYFINRHYDKKEEERKELHALCAEILNEKPKFRMKEVENEGELFFSGATDFDEAFK